MNGPQNFVVAGRLLDESYGDVPEGADLVVARAQVHATLALAAAVALLAADHAATPSAQWSEWGQAMRPAKEFVS